jgi:hypothetical protein
MPRLSAFHGTVIYMYRPDRHPHFHAQYGEHIAQIELGSWEILNGELPYRLCASSASGRAFTPVSWSMPGSWRRRLSRWSRSIRCPSTQTMLRVIAVTVLTPPRLRVEFNDGLVREIDCGFLLYGSLGEPLKDPDYFRQVSVDDELRTIVWPNGLDPAPELLHGEIVPAEAGSQRSAA